MSPIEDDARTEPVAYEPVSVKDVLVEMKDTSELLIDLTNSAVLHGSEEGVPSVGPSSTVLAVRRPAEMPPSRLTSNTGSDSR